VNTVAANLPPRNLRGDVGIITIVLLVVAGMLIWGAYRSYSMSDKKKRKIFFPMVTALSGVAFIGLVFYMYNNRKSLSNLVGAAKNKSIVAVQAAREKATAGMQGFQNWRAARAAPPPGAMGPLTNVQPVGAPPAMATR